MRKVLKISVIAIILSIVFAVNVQVNKVDASSENEELIAKLMRENEDNPESIKYLVTDRFISRIMPETKVEKFKENFSKGEEVKVYKDKTCQEEVKEGYVYSGMYAKYESNGRIFKIAVIGDIESNDKQENNIEGDGILNQIELTRIIRDYVKTEGWEIKEEEEKQSADVTCDKNVDTKDIKAVIKYIVYGGLDVPEVKKVEAPKVEIIEGRKNAKGEYVNSTKIKITQVNKEDETLKTVYKITGSKTEEYKEINGTEEVIELKGRGTYKVTAYTYGTLENKSKGANEIIQMTEEYTVTFYDEDGVTVLGTSTVDYGTNASYTGKTPTKAATQEYTYAFAGWNAPEKLNNVTENRSVRATYTNIKNKYTVTFYDEDGVTVLGTSTVDYGTNASYTGTTPTKAATQEYTYAFAGWDEPEKLNNVTENRSVRATYTNTKNKYTVTFYDEDGVTVLGTSTVDYGTNATYKGAEPTKAATQEYTYAFAGWDAPEKLNNVTENRSVRATYTNTKNKYTVTFYDEDGVTVLGTSTVDYGTNASYTGEEPTKAATEEYTYAFAGWDAPEKLNNVTENRNVKATYSKTAITYNITYDLNGGELEGGKTNPSTYTVESENITLNNPVKPGYTFIGWTGSNGDVAQTLVTIVKGSTGNKEYVANFKANEATYKVEYYKEGLDGTYVKDEEATQNIGSTVNAEVTAIAKTFKGFTYDENNVNNVKTGTVPAEGELVLKLYYKRNSYILTLNKNENIKEVSLSEENKGDSVYESYKYEQEINISATIKEQEGYKFAWSKWTTSNASLLSEQTNKDTKITMPAGNVTLTANANKTLLTYNITYNLNEGTNNSQNPNTYTVEDTITLKEATKTGYTFAGWYEKADFSGTKTVGIANRTGNITLYAKWIKNEYKVIVHHYEEGTKTKVAEDEVIKGDLGASYQTKNLIPTLDEEGNITETDGREYLNPKKYTYASVVGNESGVFTEKDIEVTYYYRVNTFEITGEAKSGGSISNVDETVRYGEDSKNTITITPDTGNRVKEITINGEKLTSYTEDRKTKVVTLETIKNVTENKHIIVTFEPIPMVAKIIEAPEGYESLIGTEYEYLSEAIEKVKTGQETNFVIQIINDIDNETNIIIDRKITIDLNSHTINANDEENATIVVRTGELKVIDSKATGKISNSKGMAIKIEEGGALNLGVDDGSIRYNSPIIEGKTTGVYNLGIFNFYDGVIRGKTAIDGGVTDTPKLYDPKVEQSGEMQESVLAKVTDVEATIGKTRYATLEQAVDAANNIKGTSEDEIEIDIVVDLAKNAKVVMDNTKNIVLDLNGYTLTNTVADYVIENQGKLKIIDSSKTEEAEGTGIIKSTTSNVLLNTESASLKVESGTIEVQIRNKIAVENNGELVILGGKVSSTEQYDTAIYNKGVGNVEITDGKITTSNEPDQSGIINEGTGTIKIAGGNINILSGWGYGIWNKSTGKIQITSGTLIFGSRYAISNGSTGTIEITGGNIEDNGMDGMFNKGTGEFIIKDITIKKTTGISNDSSGTLDITNTAINVGYKGVKNNGTANITNTTINSGNINNNGTMNLVNTTINNSVNNNGTMNLINTIVKYTGSWNSSAISNTGVLNVTGGQIENGDGTGLYNNAGTVTIGTKDGNVEENTKINSTSSTGLYNTLEGKVYYYDGVITGKNNAIFGVITEIEEDTVVSLTKDGEIESAKLTGKEPIAQVGEETFTNLKDAILKCIDGVNMEITILKDFAMTDGQTVTINENKDIVLNLNGKTITLLTKNKAITNNGKLTITDNTEEKNGQFTLRAGGLIENTGTFTMEEGTINQSFGGLYNNYADIIKNSGEVKVTGGTISSIPTYINVINSEETGNITITGGSITTAGENANTINVGGTANVEITGGNMTATGRYANALNIMGTTKVTVSGGNIITTGEYAFPINLKETANLTIKEEAIIKGVHAIKTSDGSTLIVDGGTIIGTGWYYDYVIFINGTGKIAINGGTIEGSCDAIYMDSAANLEINDGTITAKGHRNKLYKW
ncbi:MAG TPA: InlB B-repeat-containing protein [Clostridiaceae bacterium]|nr:InlB B-repeat-containing protein [Clostridiaceae bacterium]